MSLMVLGTSSHVGKSVTVAAICRALVRRGIRVAPFKSQNMSLNSYVTGDGAEIGIAQAMQAFAAKVLPSALMNPILLKPKGDSTSQVVLLGHPYKDVQIRDYYQETDHLLGIAVDAYHHLVSEYGEVIIEGAGGAAEVNLYDRDIANIRLAEQLRLPIVLVADIERGGVFAQVYGTIALLPEQIRPLVKGIIINKFRGDPTLFESGVKILEDLTGVPVLGVIPYTRLDLPSEDSLSLQDKERREGQVRIAVIRLPQIANFTDFELLERHVAVDYLLPGESLDGYDGIIIPGTKNTVNDLQALQASGTAAAIRAARGRGVPVIGICGGYQMLGKTVIDDGSEACKGTYEGLGLLDLVTAFEGYEKTTVQVQRTAAPVPPILDAIGEVSGYEIHMGTTTLKSGRTAFSGEGAVSDDGLVFGTYLHGLFMVPAAAEALLSYLYAQKGLTFKGIDDRAEEDPYDLLADHFEAHLQMDRLTQICRDHTPETPV
jgi:adenosylcobyric acid synthase